MAQFIKKFVRPLRRSILSTLVLSAALLASQRSLSAAIAEDAVTFEAVRQADMKVAAIAWRLASANAAMCDRLEPGTGIQIHTLDQFDSTSRASARAHFAFATPIAIEGVIAGSPAALAGLQADDSLVRVGTVVIADVPGTPATTERLVAAQLAIAALPAAEPLEVDVLRGGAPVHVTIRPLPVCKSRFEMRIASDWGASADGTMVQIGSRFVEEYPEDELAAVMAHEFAHNILRHREKLEARGVDYGLLAGFGANVKYFRQTELQADLLSVYLLENAGYPMRGAIGFWNKFGPSKAGGILRSRSHPAWRDRVATLQAEIARIETMSARPVVSPRIKERDRPLDGDWQSLLTKHR